VISCRRIAAEADALPSIKISAGVKQYRSEFSYWSRNHRKFAFSTFYPKDTALKPF
jgi:hypothetical protein